MNKLENIIPKLGLSIDQDCIYIKDKYMSLVEDMKIYGFTFRYHNPEYAARFIANVVLNRDKLDNIVGNKDIEKTEAKYVARNLMPFKVNVVVTPKKFNAIIYHKGKEYQILKNVSVTQLWCLHDIIRYSDAYVQMLSNNSRL